MARKPPAKPPVTPSPDHRADTPAADPTAKPGEGDAVASPLDEKFAMPVGKIAPVVPSTKPPVKQLVQDKTPTPSKAAADDDNDDDEADDDDDDDDDEELVVFTAREAAGALATVARFVRPILPNYRKMVAIVVFGVVVETLFNVIMPLSLKFLIDDALGEEDFHELYRILSILAVAGIITSIVAVWYERWDARLAASVITDVRTRLFDHVQKLPAGYYARTKRGETLSRFSIDMAAFENVVEIFANTALLPFLELIAGIILMLFLNWQLAVVALLIFPITLIGPRILTPKAVQANYEQKVQEAGLLGMVQENVAAQAVVKAFSLQRKMFGFFTLRNNTTRNKIAEAVFLRSMVERSVTVAVLLLHIVVLAIGAYLATKGQITVGTFVHLRERVLGGVVQHRASDAVHSGGDPGRRGGAPHG